MANHRPSGEEYRLRYEWWVPEPTVLLLSTSDTDLITARSSGARYRWANPSRLVIGDLPDLLTGVDVVVVRILGGYRSWQDGIDAVNGSGVPAVLVSGEQAADADLMDRSTVPAGAIPPRAGTAPQGAPISRPRKDRRPPGDSGRAGVANSGLFR